MTKFKTNSRYLKYPLQHPLRGSLTDEDWQRIQGVIDCEHEDATEEELNAASDLYYDAIAAKLQTHEGILTLQ